MVLAAQSVDVLLDRESLRDLMEHVEAGCVSLFMPTHRGGPDTREDPIRLKHQLQTAMTHLTALGWRAPDARQRLAELHDLLDDSELWRHNDLGLAMYVSSLRKGVFRLPIAVEERVVVASRFHFLPLIPLLKPRPPVYVLALSQDEVRLLEATMLGVRAVRLPAGTPTCLEDLTKFEEPQQYREFHTHTAPQQPGAKRAAVFFGQGAGTGQGSEKRRLVEYCQSVRAGVEKALTLTGAAPLVLAASEPLLSIYREVNAYPPLSDRHINGNVERLSDSQLQSRAMELLADVMDEGIRRDAALYEAALAAGRGSAGLGEILPAAHDSRIEALFVSRDAHILGRYDPVSRQIEVHEEPLPGDQDLLDLAAVRTYLAGGRVHVVPADDIPGGVTQAAVFRFPLRR